LGLLQVGWIQKQQNQGARIIGVELDEESISLVQVHQAKVKSIILLGHEHSGLPPEVWPFLDQVIEIPMMGVGSSLNVAVAGSLVLYKLAGLS
jgi:tRNA (guanosine-2'-O-)-methyltransferase